MNCSHCGTELAPAAKFCGECGKPAPHRAAEAAAERRQLTVFFIDLAGSTSLSARLDPEDLRDLLGRYQQACADVIQRYEGHVAQYLGDGILAYFGYPTAHEDDALRAVNSGLEILQRLEHVTHEGERLHTRVGIHTGLVVVGDIGGGQKQEQLALGETPNIAARLQGEAEPDTILISEVTRRLVGGHFALEDKGERTLKGIERPVRVFQPLGRSGATSRFEARTMAGLAPFVGREEEIETIRTLWRETLGGTGRTLVLRGEAGIGKSRLLGMAQQLASDQPHEVLEAECSPYRTNAALHPLIDMLALRLGFGGEETDIAKLESLEEFTSARGVDPNDAVPLLAPLFSLATDGRYPEREASPARQRLETLEILAELVLRSPHDVPVLFLMEDIHWADPTTLDLLDLLVDRQETARLFMVWTTRPEGTPPGMTASHCREISIEALPQSETRRLVAKVASKPLPEEVMRQIVARTGGVPLFVEAVTQTVIEAGVMRELEDRYELTGPMPPGLIPATVHDSLMARIDRLGEDKPLAQLASAIGREFSFELLRAVSGREAEEVQRATERLVELGLVLRSGTPPDATYLFQHALVQDAAYRSLLRKTRQEFHGKIAEALLAKFSKMAETIPELLARHFEGAGRINEAIDYWLKAGHQSAERSALVECVAHLRKAVSLLETFPVDDPERIQREMSAQLALGPALMATRGWGSREVEVACSRARELCELTNNGEGLFAAIWGLWTVPFVRGEHDRALEAAQAVMDLAQAADDRMLRVTAHYAVGFTHYFRGEFPATLAHADEQQALFDLEAEKAFAKRIQISPAVVLRAGITMSLQFLGYPERARRSQRELEKLVAEIDNPAVTGVGLGVGMYYLLDTRDVDAVAMRADRAYQLSVDAGFEFWSTTMLIYQGWAQGLRGDSAGGLALMREGLASYMGTESGIYLPAFRFMIAEVLQLDGQPEAALEQLDMATQLAEAHNERHFEAELYRLRGEIQLARGARAAGEASLRRAMEVARHQGARLLELRSATALARSMLSEGRGAEVRALLQPLYDWFSEGHAMRDLMAARTLLDQVATLPLR